jgi:solute carrier family 36 (proton-coupled amino acid transporter)
MNFLKCLVGTGIYSFPLAFSYTGWVTGIFATIFTALICVHCVVTLVSCTHKLCWRLKKPSMTFPEVVEAACFVGKMFEYC